MKKPYLSALAALFAAAVLLAACGADPVDGTSDADRTSGVSQSAEKTDDVIGATDGDIIPGVPDVTTEVIATDAPKTDASAADVTSERVTEAEVVTETVTDIPDTTPAVRPPEGK
jgi:hypothetical protein